MPNHRAFVAVTVHFEFEGEELCLPLDIVEVAASHTGEELASAFADMLKDFGIDKKVSPSRGSCGAQLTWMMRSCSLLA